MTKSYITYKYGVIWQVDCPICSSMIRSMIADDKPLASEKINGKTVIRERMVLSCLPNYREVRMAMNDGSFHVAPICASCAEDLTLEKVDTAAVKDPKAVGDRRPTLAMDVDFTIKE